MGMDVHSFLSLGSNRSISRDKPSSSQQSMLDLYLPIEKAEKFKSYDALAADTATWQGTLKATGIYEADFQRMSKAGDDYLPILRQALDQQAFTDPQAFLKTLSASELATLQNLHRLADPIQVDRLSQEGALNLLLPPGDARMDIDGDRLVSVGAARLIVFPPANAPKEVDDAWAEATAGADWEMRAHLELTMFLAAPGSSEIADAARGREGTSGIVAGFREAVARALEGQEISRRFQNDQQQAFSDRITKLLKAFDKALAARQV